MRVNLIAASGIRNIRKYAAVGLFGMAACMASRTAIADEGGVSFWLPGQFGSLAATPGTPGLSWAMLYIHPSVDAGAGARFPRGGRVDLGIQGRGDLLAFGPTYIFATPFLGAQVSASVLGIVGRNEGTVSASLTGPMGNTISGSRTQALTSVGDIIPQISLKWNQGVNNYMVYGMGDIPVGDYDPKRLANLGIGHGAIDFGGGYTYFNPQTGNELSGVLGMTYNFKNTDTQYQNGVDLHFDWGASHFFSKQFHAGLVGYYFQQITDDTGAGATLGGFRSRLAGIGPQVGFLFPVGDMEGYFNVKAYKDFAAENRPEGWSAWVTFAISPKAPEAASPRPLQRKY
ncbi:transporter [Afipia sp. OHSU_I-C4]|uniref:SphA family protein n=2 Tax=Afipia TaxID=1033 RepID=UPI00040EC7D2|nr:transporter [Afipia sp. OHSU_I-C4]